MLSIIGTPIGNLADLSPRGLAALTAATLVACEDTRRAGKLFALLGVKAPKLVSLHEHNEQARVPELLAQLKQGTHIALITDSGMPGISDPGARLVAAAQAAGVPLEVVGGPSALINAICGSGLVGLGAAHSGFVFLGFPPRTAKARANLWAHYAQSGLPLVCYEAPSRVASLCASALQVLGNRPAMVARELTKLYESWHGPDLATLSQLQNVRGECVVVIGAGTAIATAPAAPLATPASLKELAALVAAQVGISNQAAYKALLNLKDKTS